MTSRQLFTPTCVAAALALIALASLVVAIEWGMDDRSLAWGLGAGWVIGFFCAVNGVMIQAARQEKAPQRKYPYRLGLHSYGGAPYEHCPYEKDMEARALWRQGWKDAERAAESIRRTK